MALDNNLNFNFTAPQQAAIRAGFDAVLAVLNEATVPYVNLTREERKVPSIDTARMPYVADAVVNILPQFPDLASLSINLTRTTTLFQMVTFIKALRPQMEEINDRLTDMSINAENLVYKSMGDSYETSQRQEGRVPGADVLRAAIAPLFASQGNHGTGPRPPQSGGGNPDPDAPSDGGGTPPAP